MEGLAAVRTIIDLVGPASIEKAKGSFPSSLRAQFAASDAQLGFYCSGSAEQGLKDITFCFGEGKRGCKSESERARESVYLYVCIYICVYMCFILGLASLCSVLLYLTLFSLHVIYVY